MIRLLQPPHIMKMIRAAIRNKDQNQLNNYIRQRLHTPYLQELTLYALREDNLPAVHSLVLSINDFEESNRFLDSMKALIDEEKRMIDSYSNPKVNIPRYPRTRRPKSSMLFAPSICPDLTSEKSLKDNYLPVIRYAGLFFPEEDSKEYCGTFYYFEPDSTSYLNLGKTLICGNKLDAVYQLSEFERNLIDDLYVDIISPNELQYSRAFLALNIYLDYLYKRPYDDVSYKMLEKYDEKRPSMHGSWQTLLNDLKKYKEAIHDLIATSKTIVSSESELLSMQIGHANGLFHIGNSNFYAISEIVGSFDPLDQYICQTARMQGYDTILIQREPGETRLVTEILDTRPRKVSYESICKTKIEPKSISPEYQPNNFLFGQTIWFERHGFISGEQLLQ